MEQITKEKSREGNPIVALINQSQGSSGIEIAKSNIVLSCLNSALNARNTGIGEVIGNL